MAGINYFLHILQRISTVGQTGEIPYHNIGRTCPKTSAVGDQIIVPIIYADTEKAFGSFIDCRRLTYFKTIKPPPLAGGGGKLTAS